jgi:hypothetical protein
MKGYDLWGEIYNETAQISTDYFIKIIALSDTGTFTLKQRGSPTFVTASLKVISPRWTTQKGVGGDDIRAETVALTIESWHYVSK